MLPSSIVLNMKILIMNKYAQKTAVLTKQVLLSLVVLTTVSHATANPSTPNKVTSQAMVDTSQLQIQGVPTNEPALETEMTNDSKAAALKPCPNKPNCVSSQEDSSKNSYVAPFKLSIPTNQAIQRIKKEILTIERTQLVNETFNGLHITFKSRIFGFIDDVDLLLINDTVHVRSASRVGYSDLGANRKRVEKIRALLINAEIISKQRLN